MSNYSQLGVYILHGTDDDNVPVTEARSMVARLDTFHHDFIYHEEPGVGHWWDISDEPGTDCVDWMEMFDFFSHHRVPMESEVRHVNFKTSNPGISSHDYWLTIDAQIRQLEMSEVDVHVDPGKRRFSGWTMNVARLAFNIAVLPHRDTIFFTIDGQKIVHIPTDSSVHQIWLARADSGWRIVSAPSTEMKGCRRYGTFKEVFRNNVILVYGTHGSAEENEWAYGKARYDAEKLWYQGNGSIDLLPDDEFKPSVNPNRNVVLYGNAKINRAWSAIFQESPVQIDNRRIRFGERTISTSSACALVVRPRAGSTTASVGVIAGTDLNGMRLANRIPYLNPGIGLPDCTILQPDILRKGEEGVVLTGFFGLDWSIGTGEFFER